MYSVLFTNGSPFRLFCRRRMSRSFMSSLMTMEKLMFSLTYTDRLWAASTKNTTMPSNNSTSVVLMHEVTNCMSKNDVWREVCLGFITASF